MQRWSTLFIPTLREAPADAEVASHQLLLRAGYIRQLGAGIYSYLPLGWRAVNKIVGIVREEMDKIAQEFYLPALHPKEVWEESGRWTGMGDNMFRLKDRKGAELALGMTHEEIMTSIARNELRSYKQLPQIWYQIQTKFRDEPRPKSGLLRVRQFTMKDSYSFDIDAAGLDKSYDLHDAAYRRIFTRCGLEFVGVDADSGAMGGSQSQEFMVYTEAGEDWIASARDENGNVVYAANVEKASSRLEPVTDLEPTGDGMPELVHTPGKAAIADVAEFFGILPAQDIKCVAYMGQIADPNGTTLEKPVVAFLRGDHQVNETKLAGAAQCDELRPMQADELQRYFDGPAGYLGPIGLTVLPADASAVNRGFYDAAALAKAKSLSAEVADVFKNELAVTVVLDTALEGRTNLVAGANKLDYHYRNVTPGRDFTWTVATDIRNVSAGELDPVAGLPLRLGKAVEIGHIFKLGYKYSQSMGARVLDRNGKETTPIMGSYGIGIERILTSAIEQSAARLGARLGKDDRPEWSYALPPTIAPFPVVVTVTKQSDAALADAGEKIAAALDAAKIDVLLDDRDGSAGVKFKDADLIGAPYRVNIGKKLADGQVELVDRLQGTTVDVAVDDVVPTLSKLLAAASDASLQSSADSILSREFRS